MGEAVLLLIDRDWAAFVTRCPGTWDLLCVTADAQEADVDKMVRRSQAHFCSSVSISASAVRLQCRAAIEKCVFGAWSSGRCPFVGLGG